MRLLHKFLICFAVTGILVLTTSYADSDYGSWDYIPVFMKRTDLNQSVSYQSARELENPGKIYYKRPYIYINEKYKGVHVINNSDSVHPENEGFIVAPGCLDMAVKGNIMYLDNAVDLVAFDLEMKEETKRIENVFPEPVSPNNEVFYSERDREGYILVAWEKRND
ncbi:MAG: hypothetical protein LBE71_00590 [Dysgonamonadaceae bacterium]|nr:hypothetical protein [Dysgonamonadaceae bacterium]